jgi:hypothetical protein
LTEPVYEFAAIEGWAESGARVDCFFKSTKELNHDILGSLDKSKTSGHGRFHRANPHKGVF